MWFSLSQLLEYYNLCTKYAYNGDYYHFLHMVHTRISVTVSDCCHLRRQYHCLLLRMQKAVIHYIRTLVPLLDYFLHAYHANLAYITLLGHRYAQPERL